MFLPGWRHDDDADDDEWELLGPHGHVDVEAEPVDEDVECLGDGVHLAHAVKHDVHRGDEDLPGAIDWEEVAQKVEILAL